MMLLAIKIDGQISSKTLIFYICYRKGSIKTIVDFLSCIYEVNMSSFTKLKPDFFTSRKPNAYIETQIDQNFEIRPENGQPHHEPDRSKKP